MASDIEQCFDIRTGVSPSCGPDGERLSFLMDTTGTSQVWTADEPDAWPEQRTFYRRSRASASGVAPETVHPIPMTKIV